MDAVLARPQSQFSNLYDRAGPTLSVEALLHEIERDPTCIFWG